MGHGCHIGGIGLEDNTVEGNGSRKGHGEIGFLKGQHASDTQQETVELEQFAGLNLIACETMEYTTGQIIGISLENGHHLVLCLATVDHQGQTCLYRPAHLLLEGLQLLLFELAAPIEVEADFADGDDG